MKSVLPLLVFLLVPPALGAAQSDYTEHYDTPYNSITIQRTGDIVELRARARGDERLESAVDLSDPLKPIVAYTRSLYGALFLHPEPKRVLMIGLGGAGFHRLFAASFPDSQLQSVEIDPKVYELAQTKMGFKPSPRTPVALIDGRMFVKRNKEQWDWIILDAFRGGFVPPHLKTIEFYRECAARLSDRGVFVSNLHANTELFYADLKTIMAVFPQVVIFDTRPGWGNVIACAVKYRSPSITDAANWPAPESVARPPFAGRVDLAGIKAEHSPLPMAELQSARVLTDDFAPVEFLATLKRNNSDGK